MRGPTGPVRAWADHLRAGGTTDWPAWAADRTSDGESGTVVLTAAAGELPGAAQLELLRRLNVLGWPSARVEAVLRRPAPGRGPAELSVSWPPTGSAAPVREVLRVGSGLLADLVADLPGAAPVPRRAGTRRFLARRTPHVAVDGLAVTAARWRVGSTQRHRDPDLAVVVAGPPDRALAEAWSRRTQAGAARPWPGFARSWMRRGLLPPSAELGEVVVRWSARVGAGRVHVVPVDGVAALVEELHGRPVEPGTGRPRLLRPTAVDVVRRVNAVLPFTVTGDPRVRDRRLRDRRRALVDLAAQTLPPVPDDAAPAVVPDQQTWLAEAGRRVAAEVRASGCVVHGPGPLPTEPGDGVPLRGDDVLDAMVRMIHSAAARAGGTEEGRG